MVQVALIFAASKENYSPKTKISMKEQTSQPKAKRLTIHFYAAEFTQGQRRYVRRALVA